MNKREARNRLFEPSISYFPFIYVLFKQLDSTDIHNTNPSSTPQQGTYNLMSMGWKQNKPDIINRLLKMPIIRNVWYRKCKELIVHALVFIASLRNHNGNEAAGANAKPPPIRAFIVDSGFLAP
ncbi:hypothetical protein ACLOJK_039043 [Asimina triloba]